MADVRTHRLLSSRRFVVVAALVGLVSAGGGVAVAATFSHGSGGDRAALLQRRVDVMAGYTRSGNPSLVANFSGPTEGFGALVVLVWKSVVTRDLWW